ncbi:MAG TPA: hypothetical protein VFU23_02225, partial [Gemmatimonadales bacterium]|nr:hypothetical protein [Gemmatimonadales bacterium]
AVEATHPRSPSRLRMVLSAPDAELFRAVGPGLPGTRQSRVFLLLRAGHGGLRWVTALHPAAEGAGPLVATLGETPDQIEVGAAGKIFRYHLSESGATVEHDGERRLLAGPRTRPPVHTPIFAPRDQAAEAFAPFLHDPPVLDGTAAGFDSSAPLELDSEHQYRRSEEPYDAESFSARAWVNWDGEALYLAVAVSKPSMIFRAQDAPALDLDNEPEDINSDGLQIYLGIDDTVRGVMVTPADGGGLIVRPLGSADGELATRGTWNATELGYFVTLRLADDRLPGHRAGARLGFDLLINEMQPDRARRAGQLVWSGDGGWIYLRGDRHDRSRLGVLELG